MLVLSRNPNEGIVIKQPNGEPIRLVVVSVRGNKVRLGIDAPKKFAVFRDEILQKADKPIGSPQPQRTES